MLEGQLLDLGELDALVQLYRLPPSDIEAHVDGRSTASERAAAPIESYRARTNRSLPEVAGNSAGVRMRYIRQFIGWLAVDAYCRPRRYKKIAALPYHDRHILTVQNALRVFLR